MIRKIARSFCASPWRFFSYSLVLIPALSVQAQDRFDAVRASIHREIVNNSVPSVAVAIAQHGRIIWEQGFGWANREEMIPATENTMYSLASISKPFTATGLMTLVQSGRIDLDAPINDYLGEAKLKARVGNAADATVRRVANHSSGLPLHYQFFFSNEPIQKPSYDETILRYGNLVTVPGEHYQYSNLGFGIIGYVLSRVSGLSYSDFMRTAVFAPLGLTHTSIGIGPGLERYAAVRYDDRGVPIPFYDFDHPGASAVYASAHDLVRFGMFHLKDHLSDQSAILTDASIEAMHAPTISISEDAGYGIGWVSETRPDGYRLVWHNGGMPGVSTDLVLVPAEDLAVVVLLNGKGSAEPIADQILSILLPRWRSEKAEPAAPTAPFVPDTHLQGSWHGILHTWEKDLPATLTVLPTGDVHLQIADELTSLVNHVRFRDGWLTGEAWGDVQTSDAERHHANTLLLTLKLRGDVLNGAVSATEDDANPVALTEWLEVKKQ